MSRGVGTVGGSRNILSLALRVKLERRDSVEGRMVDAKDEDEEDKGNG